MPLQKKRTTASTQHRTIRRLVGVAGSLALAASFSFGRGGGVAGADTASVCTLAPAFAALRERVGPGFVGTCVADAEEVGGGDIAQPTTLGRFAWHQATGAAAFTDDRQTWLAGPGPLLWDRRNDERFDWEQDAAAGAPLPTGWGPATPPCLPAVDEWWFTGDGVTATVRNPCGAPRVLVLSAVLLDGEDGRPTGATQSAAWGAPDGDRRTVRLPGRVVGARAVHFLGGAASPDESPSLHCLDVNALDAMADEGAGSDPDAGSGRCLAVDPWLDGTVAALAATPTGRQLLRAAAAEYVVVRRQAFAFTVYGFHELGRNTAILDQRLDGESDWVRAAYLAHELRHTLDDAAGLPFGPGRDCLDREVAASRVEGQVWQELWRGRLPVGGTAVQRGLNDSAFSLSLPSSDFTRHVAARYRASCG